MRKLKILSPRFMYPEQLKILKRKRKKSVTSSVTKYSDSFVEHKEYGKGIWINPKPGDDFLYDFFSEFDGSKKNEYNFFKLPKDIQNYIYAIDEQLYQAEYRQHIGQVDNAIRRMDNKIERMEKKLGRSLTDGEHWLLMNNMPVRYEDSAFKKCRRSVSRAYNAIIGYSRANTDVFKYFVTLTFAPIENRLEHEEKGLEFKYCDNPKEYQGCYSALAEWIEVMRKYKKRKGFEFEYLMTYEKQANGNYHFHALMSEIPDEYIVETPDVLDMYKGRKMFGKSITTWKYGKSDIQEIRDKEKITTYISKYIVKTLHNMSEEHYYEFMNQKKYYVTRGLKKPETEYYEYLDGEFMQEKMASYSDKYETIYTNPYDKANISKTVYSKKIDCDNNKCDLDVI